jgi:hypothetical protein
MNPMSKFDPDKPCRVHDGLNDRFLNWKPEWAHHKREFAAEHGEGVIAWDGYLLDGWEVTRSSIPDRRSSGD